MKIGITLLFLLLFLFANAQKQSVSIAQSDMALTDILTSFKVQQRIEISYSDEEIDGIFLNIETPSITIQQLNSYLIDQSFLEIEEVTPTSYIIIRSPNNIPVCGKIIDIMTHKPLKDVYVLVNNKSGVFTDDSGDFEVTVSYKDKITLEYPGYLTQKVSMDNFQRNSCTTISIKEQLEELNEVIVEEYLTTGIEKNFDGSIGFSPSSLRILPGLTEPDLFESAQLLPGINSPGENASTLHIRGGSPDQNLVLWDDITIYHTGHFFDQISALNPYITKNVKIYRGGTSVRYGNRVSGVIDIQSDNELPLKHSGGFGFNLTSIDAFSKIPISKKAGIYLAARHSLQDAFETVTFKNIFDKVFENSRNPGSAVSFFTEEDSRQIDDTSSFYDINGKIIWKPSDKDNIQMSTLLINNSADSDSRDSNDFINTSLGFTNNGASLIWNRTLQKHSYTSKFHLSDYSGGFQEDISFNDGINMDRTIQKNTVVDIGTELYFKIDLGRNQSWLNGYQFTHLQVQTLQELINLDIDGPVRQKEEINFSKIVNNHNFFSEYQLQKDSYNLTTGIRISAVSNKILWEPRLYSSLNILPKTFVTGAFEIKNQYLNQVQGFFKALDITGAYNEWSLSGDYVLEATANFPEIKFTVPILKTTQWTGGLNYTNDGWNIDVEGYYKLLNNLSSGSQTVFNSGIDFRNGMDLDQGLTGSEKRIGMDVLVKKRIQNFRMWLGYSLSKSTLKFEELQEDPFPGNFDKRHVLNWSGTWAPKSFEFAIGWSYASGKRYTSLDSKAPNDQKLPEFHRLDVSGLYHFHANKRQQWNGTVGVSVRNIYNRKNLLDRTFREDVSQDTGELQFSQTDNSSLVPTPNFVLRLRF